MKPVSQYTIIGKSYRNTVTTSKVTARETWATDVRLPGMLHARMVHPKTLGSTLVSAGELDKTKFPNAQVVVKGNLVGVVAPTEWEAIRAAQQVASATKWTDWKGLPGSANLFNYLREGADWKTTPVTKSDKTTGDAAPALAAAPKKLSATYELPFMKHAPIGPTMAVADARPDGTVHIYTHNQNPQALRGEIAQMLGTSIDHVVVHAFAGAGPLRTIERRKRGRGRRSGDPVEGRRQAGARAVDAGRGLPVVHAVAGCVLGRRNRTGRERQDGRVSSRPLHARDAGRPAGRRGARRAADDAGSGRERSARLESARRSTEMSDPWVYDGVANLMERGHGTFQVGQKASPLAVGLRDHSMRTPGQFQQNFPRELAISEAAALAGADAIQFRIDHAKEERVIGVLKAVRDASGWETRPSPRANPVSTGATPVRGRGVSVMFRSGTYWACVCQIAVTPSTGAIAVEKYTIAVDPGIVVNPMQLKRQVEGGAVMGISHALLEEATFDESGITTRDWRTYPILKMADIPEIKVVLLNRPEVGSYGGGSEAANALAAPAIAAALFDATGKIARRLPLKADYVQAMLKA